MGYLLFLPFLLHAKGGNEATLGIGLALIFAGGALGKACCGWLGQHLGVVRCVIATEAATALFMVSTLMLPLEPALVLLPFLGIVPQRHVVGPLRDRSGTGGGKASSGRAFALFYTGVIGVGGLAPIAYGAIADHSNRTIGVAAAALTAAAIIPYGSRPASLPGQATQLGAGGIGTRMPSFSATGTFTETRALRGERHPAVVIAFVCSTLA